MGRPEKSFWAGGDPPGEKGKTAGVGGPRGVCGTPGVGLGKNLKVPGGKIAVGGVFRAGVSGGEKKRGGSPGNFL